MAATLAGVCQVPLTSVLLLFELTRDYRIIIPLMGAVGLSSWISSASMRKRKEKFNAENSPSLNINKKANEQLVQEKPFSVFQQADVTRSISQDLVQSLPGSVRTPSMETLYTSELCELESSLCLPNSGFEEEQLEELIPVAAAMRTRYVAVVQDTSIQEAMTLMLSEKEWCALVVDSDNYLEGILTLGDIQQYGQMARTSDKVAEMGTVPVSLISKFRADRGEDLEVLAVLPHTSLKAARQLMAIRGLRQLPVLAEAASQVHGMGPLVGLLDRDCIRLACSKEDFMLEWMMASLMQSTTHSFEDNMLLLIQTRVCGMILGI
eukprot:Gb_04136 [translate_table: standard]